MCTFPFLLTHSLTHSLIHSPIHSLTHSLTQSLVPFSLLLCIFVFYAELPQPMVTKEDNRNQTIIIGDTFNIEIQRRNRLRCTSNMGSFNRNNDKLQQTRSMPVVTSWLLLDENQNEDFNIPTNFLSVYN